MEVSQSPNFFQDQLQDVIALSASYGAFAALRSDGRVVTWGDVPWMDRGDGGVKHGETGETTKKWGVNHQKTRFSLGKNHRCFPNSTEIEVSPTGGFTTRIFDPRNWRRQKHRQLAY